MFEYHTFLHYSQTKVLPLSLDPCYTGNKGLYLIKRSMRMNDSELRKYTIEEFSRLQSYMLQIDKNLPVYNDMKIRYTELKVILEGLGVNLTVLDRLNE